jgi:two-component system chemotaxis sensor kinase CheA
MSGELVDAAEFLAGFVAEADEHLALASKNLLLVDAELKQGKPHPRAVRELYRSLHTVKGLSAMMGLEGIVAIAHAMETLLKMADDAGGSLHPSAPDVLVRGLRAIEQRIATVAGGGEVVAAPEALLDALNGVPSSAPTAPVSAPPFTAVEEIAAKLGDSERAQLAAAGAHAVRIDFTPSPERSARGLDITAVRARMVRFGDIVKVIPLGRPRSDQVPGGLVFAILAVTEASDAELAEALEVAPAAIQRLAGPAPQELAVPDVAFDEGAARRGVVRVEVVRLDDALEKLSALVVSKSRLDRAIAALAARGADVADVARIAHESGRQLRDLRGAIMRARMVSASEMLERLPLLVRGLARSTNKVLTLVLDTGRTELDKAVAERVFPAVVHLVRNAVDHAIEPALARERAGKPAAGTLRVRCRETSGNQLELTVEDDGAGIDVAALARRAGREVPRSEEALLALLSQPGVSTLDQATTTSGRGMGMNIVKTAIEELGGQVSLSTSKGKGTTFVLRIPLSITIVDAFSFRCGRQPFVAPVATVDEIAEVDPARVTIAPSGKGRAELRLLERHGVPVPLVSLDRLFHIEPDRAPVRKAIVVRRNGQPFGFEVDQMLGHQEVVVRPLADPLVKQPGIVGSTDLGDGAPTLVLDLLSLSARLSRRRSDVRA